MLVTTVNEQVVPLCRARARAGAMAPERSPTVGRTIVIVTCPSSDQGQMSSFSTESGKVEDSGRR